MKKLILLLFVFGTAFTVSANPTLPVNEKVLKVFKSVFPMVENAKWYEYETYYEVYFDKDAIKTRIKYDLDGKVLSTLRHYEEKSLSPFLKAKIALRYPGKKIFGVTEMNTESELTYNIVLEDDKNWFHVQSDAIGQMSVTEKFKKA